MPALRAGDTPAPHNKEGGLSAALFPASCPYFGLLAPEDELLEWELLLPPLACELPLEAPLGDEPPLAWLPPPPPDPPPEEPLERGVEGGGGGGLGW